MDAPAAPGRSAAQLDAVRNVKNWRGGPMALRWCVTALVEAQKRFRRVKGHRETPQLVAALVNNYVLDTQ